MQRSAVSTNQLVEELLGFIGSSMRSAQGEVFGVVEELDLSMTQLKLLFVLDASDEELTPSELARRLGLSAAATGRAVDALTRQGIVSRRDDEADRRVKRVALTPTGRQAVRRISAARRSALEQVVRTLAPEQRDALSAALQPLLSSSPPHDPCAASAKEPPR